MSLKKTIILFSGLGLSFALFLTFISTIIYISGVDVTNINRYMLMCYALIWPASLPLEMLKSANHPTTTQFLLLLFISIATNCLMYAMIGASFVLLRKINKFLPIVLAFLFIWYGVRIIQMAT